MNAAALLMSREPQQIPSAPDGLRIGLALAVVVHVLLVLALAFGLSWRAHKPAAVVAELWSAVPEVAAPREVIAPARPAPPLLVQTPPKPVVVATPPRVDAQIAIEKARRDEAKRLVDEREAQRQKAEREKSRAEDARREEVRRERLAAEAENQKKLELAEKTRTQEAALAAQREAYLKRIQGQAGASGDEGSRGSAVRSSGPSAGYGGRIQARIKPNIVYTGSVSGERLATVEVRCAPDGHILSRKLLKSSGSAAWDEAVLRAIDKTESLPRDTDGTVPPVLELEFNPRDLQR